MDYFGRRCPCTTKPRLTPGLRLSYARSAPFLTNLLNFVKACTGVDQGWKKGGGRLSLGSGRPHHTFVFLRGFPNFIKRGKTYTTTLLLRCISRSCTCPYCNQRLLCDIRSCLVCEGLWDSSDPGAGSLSLPCAGLISAIS